MTTPFKELGTGKERGKMSDSYKTMLVRAAEKNSRRKFQKGMYDQDFLILQTMLFVFGHRKTIGYL